MAGPLVSGLLVVGLLVVGLLVVGLLVVGPLVLPDPVVATGDIVDVVDDVDTALLVGAEVELPDVVVAD